MAATQSTTITIRIPQPLRPTCDGAPELVAPVAVTPTVGAVLAELERRYPRLHRSVCDDTGAVRRHVNLFVNDSHVRERQGLDTPLVAGDVVTILPAVSGG